MVGHPPRTRGDLATFLAGRAVDVVAAGHAHGQPAPGRRHRHDPSGAGEDSAQSHPLMLLVIGNNPGRRARGEQTHTQGRQGFRTGIRPRTPEQRAGDEKQPQPGQWAMA